MLRFKTYAENIRFAMDTTDNPHGHPMTIRQVADAVGYSYEHIRKMYKGAAVAGWECHKEVCEFLGLDINAMWDLAQREKIAEKIGYKPVQIEDPLGRQLREYWTILDEDDRRVILKMAQGLATQTRQLASA